MMNNLTTIKSNLFKMLILLGLTFMTSCGVFRNKNMIPSKTVENKLDAAKGKGILFGHQDDLAYGMGWRDVPGESDVKRISGDYPAVFGWELGGIELEHTFNLDTVPFTTIRELSIKAYNMGGINTYSWHPFSAIDSTSSWDKDAIVVKHIIPGGSNHEAFKNHLDHLGDFLKSLKAPNGKQIPFIFRPWHEMDGSWFWWGSKQSTTEEFKTLFQFTIDYLRKKGIRNMLVAYSPDKNFKSLAEYFTWYPGDKYVDVMGMDNYADLRSEAGVNSAIEKLHIVIEAAKLKNKYAALTETGLENVTNSTWFTQVLGAVLKDPLVAKELSYTMLWRSDEKVHFFFTYPGHPAAEDARKFLSQPEILLLEDINKLKSK